MTQLQWVQLFRAECYDITTCAVSTVLWHGDTEGGGGGVRWRQNLFYILYFQITELYLVVWRSQILKYNFNFIDFINWQWFCVGLTRTNMSDWEIVRLKNIFKMGTWRHLAVLSTVSRSDWNLNQLFTLLATFGTKYSTKNWHFSVSHQNIWTITPSLCFTDSFRNISFYDIKSGFDDLKLDVSV